MSAGRSADRREDVIYAALPFTARRTGTSQWAVYDPYSGVGHTLDDLSAQVLSLCRGAGSLERFVLLIAAAAAPSVDVALLRAVVADLVARGLLYRVERPNRCAVTRRVDPPTIGVVTADRPKALQRCVRHLTRHGRRFGGLPEMVVVDGSRDAANRTANREFLRHWRSTTGAPCRYVGDGEVRNLQGALAARGLDADLLAFGLRGGAGANRNVLTLLTVGDALVTFDDDVICRPWEPPGAEDGGALGGHDDPREHSFHEDRQGAIGDLAESDIDVGRAHGALLGRTLREFVQERAGRLDVHDACPHLLRWLHEKEDATVRLTFAGIAGDSGVSCPYSMLFAPMPGGRRSWADASDFAIALRSREVRRVVRSDTVTDRSWCMAYCMGLDNRTLVPPFMPRGRNQDGVFGAMMSHLDPTTLSAHLRFGVVHDSDRPSAYSPTIAWASATRVSDFVFAALGERGPRGASRAARLESLGRTLCEIGQASGLAFRTFSLRAALDDRCAALAAAASAEDQLPAYWQAAVERCRQTFMQSASTPEFFLASDLATAGTVDERRAGLQRFITQFGELTAAWPAITDAAASLDRSRPEFACA